jgi:hypothetical protein
VQRGILRLEGFDPGLVVLDICPAGIQELGEFDDAGGHRAALAVEVFLLLAFRGDADPDFVEGVQGGALAFACGLHTDFRFAAREAGSIELGGGDRDRGFQLAEVGETGAQRLLDRDGFA